MTGRLELSLLGALAGLVSALAQGATSRATVRGMGDCADVTSPACVVRDFWPRVSRASATGVSVYWLTDGSRVCFVGFEAYTRAAVGSEWECVWRWRQP